MTNIPVRILYALFVVSGFCGLIYESIWSHYLKLFLGHAAYAQTVVLVVFIGGLALGAWLAGHFATRVKRPLLVYAAAEFIVGVSALVFHRVFVAGTQWAYTTLLPATCGAESWCWSQWTFAAILILPQSILLGTTFPLMTSGVLRIDPGLPGSKLSLLYFLNSIGAVGGVLASGFLLIPLVGLPGVLLTAGILNIALAIAVYFVDKRAQPAQSSRFAADGAPGALQGPRMAVLLLLVAMLTGLSSFIYEIAWIRSLSLVLGSATHSFELMLASFILGLALGGLWIRSRIDRIADPVRFLAIVQIVMGLLAAATLPVYSASFDLMAWVLEAVSRTEAGYAVYLLLATVICLLVMLPATFMAGMTLPLITYHLLRSRGGRALDRARLRGEHARRDHRRDPRGARRAAAAGDQGNAARGRGHRRGAGRRTAVRVSRRRRAGPLAHRLERCRRGRARSSRSSPFISIRSSSPRACSGIGRASWPAGSTQVLFHRDGKTASVDVLETASIGSVSILTNGKSRRFGRRDVDMAPEPVSGRIHDGARWPPCRSPTTRRSATRRSSASARACRRRAPRLPGNRARGHHRDRARHDRGGAALPPADGCGIRDPRSHIVIDDAKSYFARSDRRYDLIVSEPSNPWVSGVASLYTREFYQRIRGQLNPGGVLRRSGSTCTASSRGSSPRWSGRCASRSRTSRSMPPMPATSS